MAALTIFELVKKHGDFTAVNKLDLTISQGEIVSILGPSGCGKTTLLRCVAGLEPIDAGQISIGDRVVSSSRAFTPPESRNIGMVFQSYALWPHLTVHDNIAMGMKVKERSREEIKWRVDRTMKSLEIEGLGKRYPSQLSGGQQQRVAVARAVVVEPEILLFDEPLSNLDSRIRERVRGELHDLLREFGITTLYVTHDKAEAMALSDRIVVMRGGVIQQVGSSRDIFETPATSFVADFIGRSNFIPAAPAGTPGHAHTVIVRGQPIALMHKDAGAEGTVGFKPEDVVLASHGGENIFEVPVTRQTYFGSFVEVVSELFGTPVIFTLPQAVTNDTVLIRLPADKLCYFDKTGQAQVHDEPARQLLKVAE